MCETHKCQCNKCSECEGEAKDCYHAFEFRDFWIYCPHYNHVAGICDPECEHKNATDGDCDEDECPLVSRVIVSGEIKDRLDALKISKDENYVQVLNRLITENKSQKEELEKLELVSGK